MNSGVAAARRGLAVYLSITFVVSGVIEAWMMVRGAPIREQMGLVFALMWTPTAAAVVARLALREGFVDPSFRFGGPGAARAYAESLAYPILVGAIAYGVAWGTGLASFAPPELEGLLTGGSGGPARFAMLLFLTATLGVFVSSLTAAGEEFGWRGYMLGRLVDARLGEEWGLTPRPVLLSAVFWGLWHLPLILSGLYAAGPHPWLSGLVFFAPMVAVSFLMAAHRVGTGSVWPAVALHAAWNSIIQGAFDASTPERGIWVGEAGLLTGAACALVAWAFLSSRRASVPEY